MPARGLNNRSCTAVYCLYFLVCVKLSLNLDVFDIQLQLEGFTYEISTFANNVESKEYTNGVEVNFNFTLYNNDTSSPVIEALYNIDIEAQPPIYDWYMKIYTNITKPSGSQFKRPTDFTIYEIERFNIEPFQVQRKEDRTLHISKLMVHIPERACVGMGKDSQLCAKLCVEEDVCINHRCEVLRPELCKQFVRKSRFSLTMILVVGVFIPLTLIMVIISIYLVVRRRQKFQQDIIYRTSASNLDRAILLFVRPIQIVEADTVYLSLCIVKTNQIEDMQQSMAHRRSYPSCQTKRYRLNESRNNMNVKILDIGECWETSGNTSGMTEDEVIDSKDLYGTDDLRFQPLCEFRFTKQSQTSEINGTLHVQQVNNNVQKLNFQFPYDLTDPSILDSESRAASIANLLDINTPEHVRYVHTSENHDSTNTDNLENVIRVPNTQQEHIQPQEKTESTSSPVISNNNGTNICVPTIMRQVEEVEPDAQTGLYDKIKIQPSTRTSRQYVKKTDYDMLSTNKGLAYILNNNEFAGPSRRREGSEVDFRNVIHLFTELGYEIESHTNLYAKDIDTSIMQFVDRINRDVLEYNSCVVVLMSHGDSGYIYGIDEERVQLSKLWAYFDIKKCPKLSGKPKLFFVQSCRSSDRSDPSNDTRIRNSIYADSPGNTNWRPERADIHLAYATTEGSLSLRNKVRGSWFVQAVVEVFLARAHDDNLDQLMNSVTQRVSIQQGRMYNPVTEQMEDVTQTPQRETTLRKNLYFYPVGTHGLSLP